MSDVVATLWYELQACAVTYVCALTAGLGACYFWFVFAGIYALFAEDGSALHLTTGVTAALGYILMIPLTSLFMLPIAAFIAVKWITPSFFLIYSIVRYFRLSSLPLFVLGGIIHIGVLYAAWDGAVSEFPQFEPNSFVARVKWDMAAILAPMGGIAGVGAWFAQKRYP